MSGPAERFLDGLERHGSTIGTEEQFVALVREHPDSLPSLVEGGLRRRLTAGSRYLGRAVSYLPADAVGAVGELALELHVPGEKDSVAEEVLAQVALQFPRLLHPRLTEIFEREVNARKPHAAHPWRESGNLHYAYLMDVARAGGKPARRVLDALLETRTPAAFRAADRHPELLLPTVERLFGGGIGDHLLEVGYEPADAWPARAGLRWVRTAAGALLARVPWAEKGWRRLYLEASYHLRFPDGYLPEPGPGWRDHPTYHLDADGAAPARLGGAGSATCRVCGRQAHHLLTLDPVPAGLGVASVRTLTLETCFRCIWSDQALWWKHDRAGRPAPHRKQRGEPGDATEAAAILETTVRLVPTPARWYWQEAANERENLARLGGHPSWMQDAAYPPCPDCGRTMTFLFQLDAGLPGDGGATFGDGILYTCWCDACRVSVSFPQGT